MSSKINDLKIEYIDSQEWAWHYELTSKFWLKIWNLYYIFKDLVLELSEKEEDTTSKNCKITISGSAEIGLTRAIMEDKAKSSINIEIKWIIRSKFFFFLVSRHMMSGIDVCQCYHEDLGCFCVWTMGSQWGGWSEGFTGEPWTA